MTPEFTPETELPLSSEERFALGVRRQRFCLTASPREIEVFDMVDRDGAVYPPNRLLAASGRLINRGLFEGSPGRPMVITKAGRLVFAALLLAQFVQPKPGRLSDTLMFTIGKAL